MPKTVLTKVSSLIHSTCCIHSTWSKILNNAILISTVRICKLTKIDDGDLMGENRKKILNHPLQCNGIKTTPRIYLHHLWVT